MNSPFNSNCGNEGSGPWQPSSGARKLHAAKANPYQKAQAWVHGKHIPSTVTDPWSGLLPEGRYVAVIDDIIPGENDNGKDFYKLIFRVTQGEHRGAKAIRLLWLTPEGENAARFFCELIGLTLENVGQQDPTGLHCWIQTEYGRDECIEPASVVRRVQLIDMSGAAEDGKGGPHHG